jgi:hypothetical protein
MSSNLNEAAADVLKGNVSKKRAQADKPQKLPGEVQDLGAPTVKPDAPATGPATADKAVSKDGSQSSQTGKHKAKVGAEKVHKMKNKQKVPMQEDQELEEEDIVNEEEIDEEESLEEGKKDDAVDIEPSLSEEEEDETVSEEEDLDEEESLEEAVDNLPSIDDIELDLSEDIEAMFGGSELSEEFMEKAATVFEAAVRSQVKNYENHLREAYEEALEDTVTEIQEAMESDVSDYLEYVTEQWVAENEVAIESGLRNELAEDFISGLHNLFTEHYIDVPEDKVDVVEEMASKVEELTEQLNEAIEANVEMMQTLKEHARDEAILEASEGLTDTQAEKLRSLAEEVEYKDADTFMDKLNTLKESYFKTEGGKSRPKSLDEEVIQNPEMGKVEEEIDLPANMKGYATALGRFGKKS